MKKQYDVWMRYHRGGDASGVPSDWLPTQVTIIAKHDKDAHNKLKRRYRKAGFHAMSLVTVPFGVNPNANILEGKDG